MKKLFASVLAGITSVAAIGVAVAGTATCEDEVLRREIAQQVNACPRGTLNLVIGYNPGGNTYMLGNGFITYLRRVAGNDSFTVTMEAKPGASGEIASRYVAGLDAREAACQVLVAQSNQLTTNQIGLPNPVDPTRDLVPIALLGESPLVVTINPAKTSSRSIEDWGKYLATAKGAERHDFYGSNGNYATDHLATERLMQAIGTQGTHVPFTGSAPMILSLVGAAAEQQIDFGLLALGLVSGHFADGRLMGLAVAQKDPVRIRRKGREDIVIPSIDRIAPDFRASIWVALAGGRRMPEPLGRALEHASECFAVDTASRDTLVGELLFTLGGSRSELIERMKVETADAHRIFVAKR
jgi:tripartite-type tricarboxylate transporter receptor subunit TctC